MCLTPTITELISKIMKGRKIVLHRLFLAFYVFLAMRTTQASSRTKSHISKITARNITNSGICAPNVSSFGSFPTGIGFLANLEDCECLRHKINQDANSGTECQSLLSRPYQNNAFQSSNELLCGTCQLSLRTTRLRAIEIEDQELAPRFWIGYHDMVYIMDIAMKDFELTNKTGILSGGEIVGCKYESRFYSWDWLLHRDDMDANSLGFPTTPTPI